jgi:hexosaminidase
LKTIKRLPIALSLFCCGVVLLHMSLARAQTAEQLPLMPLPAKMATGVGHFIVDSSFGISLSGYAEPRLDSARQRFLTTLSHETGIPLWRLARFNQPNFTIQTKGASDSVQALGEDESYHLEVTPTQVQLLAANPLGVLRGLQTFLQLVSITPEGFAVPVVTIDDRPRFPWRGLMIDVSRHFMPIDVIERNLDGMEAVKLNVFHWHLSDDQGFRVESKRFPLLQEKGSDGLYYTQQQIREVVQYARDRGIRVVPEFDMPCHTTSWFVGYPDLASGPGPYKIARQWGVLDAAMDPTRESTYTFIDQFLGEMTTLFPDSYFHVGGDECDGKEWDANQKIQLFMHRHNIKTNAALQAYFSGRVQKLVAAHHKIMEGWDEVLQPDTPRDVVIQSWRGDKDMAIAARQGNRAILSTGYYIDLNQSAAQHYLVDPMGGDAATLLPEEKARILGGEAAMWSEFVTPENIDSRIWPRTAAIAERLWSPEQVRNVESMYQRLGILSQKLQYDGLQHISSTTLMLQRMSGEADPKPLEVLAAVVQPPEGYQRGALRAYNSDTPLNRLIDAIPPESETALRFSDLAKAIAAGNATPEQWHDARTCLVLWRDNDAKLEPSLDQSQLTVELAPVSKTLSQVASIALAALDNLQNHKPANAQRVQTQLDILTAAAKPQAVVVDMVVPSARLLVQATASQPQ